MTFYEAAIEVLRGEGRALHFKKITANAVRRNLLSHVGRTPEQTMEARLTQEASADLGSAPKGLRRGLARAVLGPEKDNRSDGDEIDFDAAEAYMRKVLAGAHAVFRRHVLEPGALAQKSRQDEALPRPRPGSGTGRARRKT